MEVPTPLRGKDMSIYERMQEEKRDGKKAKVRRAAARPQVYSKFADAKRKKNTLWRYYRAAARARKTDQERRAKCPIDDNGNGWTQS